MALALCLSSSVAGPHVLAQPWAPHDDAVAPSENDEALDATHWQIGPRVGGLVAPTFDDAHPIAGVVRGAIDLGVRFSSVFDLRAAATFLYEASDFEQAFLVGALTQALFWIAPPYGLGLGLGGGYEQGQQAPGRRSDLDGQGAWFAGYVTPVALQFGTGTVRFEVSLNLGVVDFTAHSGIRPFGTIDIALLFWP
jgi:hypothetical protein